jgi:mRNA interferase RelE/StbE
MLYVLVYKVLLEQQAERHLRRLTIEDYRRVIAVIKALADNLRPPGCHKITGSKRDWRIRVGTYAVSATPLRIPFKAPSAVPRGSDRLLMLSASFPKFAHVFNDGSRRDIASVSESPSICDTDWHGNRGFRGAALHEYGASEHGSRENR